MSIPSVQWRLDNQDEIEYLLREHEFRCLKDGDDLLIQAWGGLSTHLSPGDCLLLDGDRLGIMRVDLNVEN